MRIYTPQNLMPKQPGRKFWIPSMRHYLAGVGTIPIFASLSCCSGPSCSDNGAARHCPSALPESCASSGMFRILTELARCRVLRISWGDTRLGRRSPRTTGLRPKLVRAASPMRVKAPQGWTSWGVLRECRVSSCRPTDKGRGVSLSF